MLNYYSPASIFSRFRRVMLTKYQPDADRFFQRASEMVPEIEVVFGQDLLEFERFLLGALLVNIREIRGLRVELDRLRVVIYQGEPGKPSGSEAAGRTRSLD